MDSLMAKPRFCTNLKSVRLHAGDGVHVRSKEQISTIVDRSACLARHSSMREMFKYCGKTFRVFKRAHKTCSSLS